MVSENGPDKRPLGRTGISVCKAALGCGDFGGVGSPRHLIGRGLSHDAALAALDEGVAMGLDLLDTANSYAGGTSERWIGEWLRSKPAETRSRVRIATKIGTVVSDTGISVDLSPRNIIAQLTESLERLGVARIDFCLSHGPDPATPIESTLEGFAEAIERGLVSHIGAGNIKAEQLVAALEASARLGLPRYEWVQNEFNLLKRQDEHALFGLCREHGLGYTPYSPMAGGLLSGAYSYGQSPPPESRMALRPEFYKQLPEALFDKIARLEAEAKRRNCSTGALALAWVMSHPRVTSALCGPTPSAPHLASCREALALDLDEAARNEIAAWFE